MGASAGCRHSQVRKPWRSRGASISTGALAHESAPASASRAVRRSIRDTTPRYPNARLCVGASAGILAGLSGGRCMHRRRAGALTLLAVALAGCASHAPKVVEQGGGVPSSTGPRVVVAPINLGVELASDFEDAVPIVELSL